MSHVIALLLDAAARTTALEVSLKFKPSPPLILMYHGVSKNTAPSRFRNGESLRNCEGKHIAVDLFVEHLRVLRRLRRVISLSELIAGLDDRQDMRNTVVITFDDGYENNALVAAPTLADFNMPASFFLATGFIGMERCIWTDHLEVALDRTQSISLRLPGGGDTLSLQSLPEKRFALSRIKATLKSMPTRNINDSVEELTNRLGVSDIYAEGDYRFMRWEQACALVDAGFDVGAHTVSHPILTKISFEDASAEILGSRDKILKETGQCSSTFCFPNGKRNDFNAEIKGLCRKYFKAALSTERGAATAEDMFELKRLSPGGPGNGENFEWMLLRGR